VLIPCIVVLLSLRHPLANLAAEAQEGPPAVTEAQLVDAGPGGGLIRCST
jgi:hypothetical protein